VAGFSPVEWVKADPRGRMAAVAGVGTARGVHSNSGDESPEFPPAWLQDRAHTPEEADGWRPGTTPSADARELCARARCNHLLAEPHRWHLDTYGSSGRNDELAPPGRSPYQPRTWSPVNDAMIVYLTSNTSSAITHDPMSA
jgi:hypothetical protein